MLCTCCSNLRQQMRSLQSWRTDTGTGNWRAAVAKLECGFRVGPHRLHQNRSKSGRLRWQTAAAARQPVPRWPCRARTAPESLRS
jgi:hypothetical protein